MQQTLLIALAAGLPLAALGWIVGQIADRSHLSAAARCAVWTFAMLAPVALVPAMLAVQAAEVRSPIAIARPVVAETDVTPVAQPAAPIAISTRPEPIATARPSPVSLRPGDLLLALLAAGVILRLGGLALRYGRLRRLVAASRPLTDERVLSRLNARTPPVRIGPAAEPLLAGAISPVILLPERLARRLLPEDTALICAHELAHLRRGDHLWSMVEPVLLALFWFNPLLSASAHGLSAAREEACDALVLETADVAVRRRYATTLIDALKSKTTPAGALAFTGFPLARAKRRVQSILRPRACGSGLLAAGLALSLIATTGAASIALAAEPPQAMDQLITAARQLPLVVRAAVTAPEKIATSPAAQTLAQVNGQRVRLEIRVVNGAAPVMQEALSGTKENGFSFTVGPGFSSTYEGGPTARAAGDIDAALAGFSPNELRIRRVGDVMVRSGENRLVEPEHFRGAGIPLLFGPPMMQFFQDGRVLGVQTGGYRDPSATVLFELELRPVVRPGGAVELTLTPRQSIPEQPIFRPILDENTCDTLPQGPRRCPMKFEPTGEVKPPQTRQRTATFTLKEGDVLAIGGLNPIGLAPGSRFYGTGPTAILIRPVIERAPTA